MRGRAARLPYLVVGLSVTAYIALAVAFTTGYNPASKLRELALEYGLLLPGLVWVLWRERRLGPARGESRAPAALFAILYLALTIPLAFLVRNGIYNADESAYRFQARTMLAGSLSVPAPPLAASDLYLEHHVVYAGRWFGKYPPGWPALLAGADAASMGWLLNPVLGLAVLWLSWRIAARLFDQRAARGAVLILAASPYFTLNCVGYMSHPACALALAGATLLLHRALDSGRTADFAAMFALLAAAFLIRPATGTAMGAVLVAAMIWRERHRPAMLTAHVALGAAFALIAGGLLLADNYALTGSPWLSPYAAFRGTKFPIELNFQPANLLHNVHELTSVSLAKTVLHAFPFVFLLAAYAVWRDRRFWPWLLAALFVSVVAVYLPQVEVSDSVIGERYYVEAYPAIAILAARGWTLLRDRWRPPAYAVSAVLLGLLAVQAFHYMQLEREVWRLKRSLIGVLDAVDDRHPASAVAFMKNARGFNARNFNPNAADWRNEPVFWIRDPGPARRTGIACALGRPEWFVVTYDFTFAQPVIEDEGRCPAAP